MALDLSRHCDDVSEDPECPPCLRDWINFERLPASAKLHDASYDWIARACDIFASLIPHFHVDARPQCYATDAEGVRVRLTMASRLGDVGVSSDLRREYGYGRRCPLGALRDFSATP